jgi:hypothetical protein
MEKGAGNFSTLELEEVRIKKIGVLSFANILGIVGIFTGLVLGILTITIVPFLPGIPYIGSYIASYSSFGYFSIIAFPIFQGIFGFISGLFLGLFYNLAAKMAHGIKIYS